jgi:hypothetical protein
MGQSSDMRKPGKPKNNKPRTDPNQNSGQGYERKISGDIHVRGQIEADVPESLIEKYKTARNENTPRDNARFIVECITLGLVFLYAALTAIQSCESVKSADAAKSAADTAAKTLAQSIIQFAKEQRPYIGETSRSTQSPIWAQNPIDRTKGQILWKWTITNYGKSPDKNATFTQEMKLAGGEWEPSYGESGPVYSAPMPPGQDQFDDVISGLMTRKDYERLLGITDGISIRIKISYFGPDDTQYGTGLCLSRTNAGSIGYCNTDTENYIH